MLLRNLLKDERIFYLAVSFVFITDKHKRGKNLCSLFYTETYKRRCIETNASVRYSGKTMRLLYDLTATQPSPESKFHGGGAYGEVVFFKLLDYLDRVSLYCVYDAKSYINPQLLEKIRMFNIPLFDINKTPLLKIVKDNNLQRAYSAMLNLSQKWPLDDVRVYTTVHGLRTVEMPTDYTMHRYETNPFHRCKSFLNEHIFKGLYRRKMWLINGKIIWDPRIQIITISNHSLASIRSFYPEAMGIHVPVFASPTFDQLDNYREEEVEENADALQELGIEEHKYFLMTSAARWIKNTIRAVAALDSLFSTKYADGYKAVVTGVTNPSVFLHGIKNKKRFVFLDYIERPLLNLLTEKQYAFIYPSLNEGFGYPPIHAMKHGAPVAASGTSSIPEVCGDAALYFDPYSVSEIRNRLFQLLDADIHADYSARGLKRYEYISAKQKRDLTSLVEFIIEENADSKF